MAHILFDKWEKMWVTIRVFDEISFRNNMLIYVFYSGHRQLLVAWGHGAVEEGRAPRHPTRKSTLESDDD